MEPSRRQTDPLRQPGAYDPARRRLSARERDVAVLLADGLRYAAIAERLSLAETTVASYVRRIGVKLRLGHRAAIVAWVAARRSPTDPARGLGRAEDAARRWAPPASRRLRPLRHAAAQPDQLSAEKPASFP